MEYLHKEVGEKLRQLRRFARKNKEYLFNESLEDFISFVYLLPPNNYGTRIQNRIIKKLGLTKTATKNKADCLNKQDEHVEIKVSIIDDDDLNTKLNISNVMEWQNYIYYFVAFDIRRQFEVYFFELTQSQLNEELAMLPRVRNTHNQNLSNEQHVNITKKFEIDINSKDWIRWCEKYRCKYKEKML